jgi:23S rRNA pseudouridine1911/1915/1917 synthase
MLRLMKGSLWTVTRDEAGSRLDKFLAGGDRLGSRGRAIDAISRGRIFVNDAEVGTAERARKMQAGDRVRLWVDRPGSAKRRPSPSPVGLVRVVYEDDDLLVVDKPAGLLSVPLPNRPGAPSVSEEVGRHLRSHRSRRPFIVHRIDRDTSGLVVIAKHAAAHAALKAQFLRREPERVYLAVVYGVPSPSSGRWRDRLSWDRRMLIQKKTHRHDPSGREAVSEYRVIEPFRDAALIEVRLVTGKRNQIRIQARLRGHVLIGEQRYVSSSESRRTVPFPRQALHAFRLGFVHPTTNRPMKFEAPMPEDFRQLVAGLRREQGTSTGIPTR